eukprot:1196141-Prorocentrum_minimum.AAC.3
MLNGVRNTVGCNQQSRHVLLPTSICRGKRRRLPTTSTRRERHAPFGPRANYLVACVSSPRRLAGPPQGGEERALLPCNQVRLITGLGRSNGPQSQRATANRPNLLAISSLIARPKSTVESSHCHWCSSANSFAREIAHEGSTRTL